MITSIIAMESEAEILLKNATVTAEKPFSAKKRTRANFTTKNSRSLSAAWAR